MHNQNSHSKRRGTLARLAIPFAMWVSIAGDAGPRWGLGAYLNSSGNTVPHASAQKNAAATNFVQVGRTWSPPNFKAFFYSHNLSDGSLDTNFASGADGFALD